MFEIFSLKMCLANRRFGPHNITFLRNYPSYHFSLEKAYLDILILREQKNVKAWYSSHSLWQSY